MSTRTANVAARSGVQRLRVDEPVHEANLVDLAGLRRTLAATERRYAAALRQLDRMRRRDTLRKREAASLREAVVKAQRFAYHDELTGLPNRHALLDHFDLAVALAARHDQCREPRTDIVRHHDSEIAITASLGIAMHPIDEGSNP